MSLQETLYPEQIQVTSDFSYGWIMENRILIVQLNSATRETIDAWMKYSREIRETWDVAKPLMIVADVSQGSFFPSAYTTSELQKILKVRPEIHSYSAIVLSKNFVSHLIETMVRLGQRQGRPNQNRIFYNREEAVKWLMEQAAKDD